MRYNVTEREKQWQERRLENVIKSNLGAPAKIRTIIGLGFHETMARMIVAQAEASRTQVAYYERIGPLIAQR